MNIGKRSVPRRAGQWLENLGIGSANSLVGRPDSIAVRMPDNCVTSYLIDQTGPVATTSANPTGEADTTHHLQVLAKLGLENVGVGWSLLHSYMLILSYFNLCR